MAVLFRNLYQIAIGSSYRALSDSYAPMPMSGVAVLSSRGVLPYMGSYGCGRVVRLHTSYKGTSGQAIQAPQVLLRHPARPVGPHQTSKAPTTTTASASAAAAAALSSAALRLVNGSEGIQCKPNAQNKRQRNGRQA